MMVVAFLKELTSVLTAFAVGVVALGAAPLIVYVIYLVVEARRRRAAKIIASREHAEAYERYKKVLEEERERQARDGQVSSNYGEMCALAIDTGPLFALRTEQNDPATATQADAIEVQAGKLAENIPRKMQVNRRQLIEARIGRNTPTLVLGFQGSGDITMHDLPIVESMAVDLISSDGKFAIERVGERTQIVQKSAAMATLLGAEPGFAAASGHGSWQWFVTPTKAGPGRLSLRVSAKLRDSRGIVAGCALVPDRIIDVLVHVSRRDQLVKFLKWAGVALATGAVTAVGAAIMRDETVWPFVKGVFEACLGAAGL